MAAVLEPLRVPGAERANLVHDPSLSPRLRPSEFGEAGLIPLEGPGLPGDVPKTLGLVDPLVQQEGDVVEKETAASLHAYRARHAARGDVGGLGEDPRIAQCATAHEHTCHPALPEPIGQLLGFDTVSAAEH